MLLFGLVALVQAAAVFGLTIGLLGLHIAGPSWLLFTVALADGLDGGITGPVGLVQVL